MWMTPSKRKYAKYRDSNRECAAKRYEERAAWLRELKSKPCMDCGGTFLPCQMDFDHREGENKLLRSLSGNLCIRKERLVAEMAKCDLVCANCHRLRTHLRLQRSSPWTTLLDVRSPEVWAPPSESTTG